MFEPQAFKKQSMKYDQNSLMVLVVVPVVALVVVLVVLVVLVVVLTSAWREILRIERKFYPILPFL